MSDGTQPTLAELHLAAVAKVFTNLHTIQVGTVVAWNRDAQTADVQLVVQRRVPRADGTFATETLPILPDVRVLSLTGGGTRLAFDLAEGDGLLYMCTEYSIRDWLEHGNVALPSDLRTHALAHGLALPCITRVPLVPDPDGAAVLAAPTMLKLLAPEIRIGDDMATFAALASKVDMALANIRTACDGAIAGAIPSDGGIGAFTTFKASLAPTPGPWVPPAVMAPLDPTACTKVKIT